MALTSLRSKARRSCLTSFGYSTSTSRLATKPGTKSQRQSLRSDRLSENVGGSLQSSESVKENKYSSSSSIQRPIYFPLSCVHKAFTRGTSPKAELVPKYD